MNTKCRSCASYWHRPGCAKYKPRKQVRPVSLKRARRMRALAAKRRIAMCAGITRCHIKWEGVCTGNFDGWHHLRKLSQGGTDDATNLVPACNPCNDEIENQPTEAERRGWVIREEATP